jgi:hypothetical protein
MAEKKTTVNAGTKAGKDNLLFKRVYGCLSGGITGMATALTLRKVLCIKNQEPILKIV